MNNALHYAQTRYTCKAYDPNRKIGDDNLTALLEMLRLAPSSINIQPWQFLVTDKSETKTLISQATTGNDAHNAPKILNASHIIVLCTRTDVDNQHLMSVLESEKAAGRFASDEIMQARLELCQHYILQMASDNQKLIHWAENQTFIALGHLLLSASLLGIDATPIGGYDAAVLDASLGLADKGLKSSVLVALGYAADNDNNRRLPKARLDMAQVIKFI
ncbi:oxygen-insensitive NAD(P)H nitroreductase [Moraxella sp. ZJ142]|uniref:oxygen-insensitive NAD(P)H nitroreductase n=1 Tax=Moraxella marmotae TaxID=3344520 RepID=UPI0035D44100